MREMFHKELTNIINILGGKEWKLNIDAVRAYELKDALMNMEIYIIKNDYKAINRSFYLLDKLANELKGEDKESAKFSISYLNTILKNESLANHSKDILRDLRSATYSIQSFEGEDELILDENNIKEYVEKILHSVSKGNDHDSTGFSGNTVKRISWKGRKALLKIGIDSSLRSEVANYSSFEFSSTGCNPKILYASVETTEKRHFYVQELVGDNSLLEYIFEKAIARDRFDYWINRLLDKLISIHCSRLDLGIIPNVKWNYVDKIKQTIIDVAQKDNIIDEMLLSPKNLIINGHKLINAPILLNQLSDGVYTDPLSKIAPLASCPIHGDPHFRNIRISDDGSIWFIDPKGIIAGDYLYDYGKVLMSLSGGGHIDISRNKKAMRFDLINNPIVQGNDELRFILKNPMIQNSLLERGYDLVIEKLKITPSLTESDPYWRERLQLILARHYISAAPYYLDKGLDYFIILYGIGVQQLNKSIEMLKEI